MKEGNSGTSHQNLVRHDHAAAKALGRRIRELREATGLSQRAAATRAGIDRNSWGLIERGMSGRPGELPANPGFLTLIHIAATLGVPPGELLTEIETDATWHPHQAED